MINSSSKFWPLWKKNHFFDFWYFFNETNSFKRKFDQKLPLFTTIEKLRNWPWNFSAQKKNAFSQKYFQQHQRRQKEGFFFWNFTSNLFKMVAKAWIHLSNSNSIRMKTISHDVWPKNPVVYVPFHYDFYICGTGTRNCPLIPTLYVSFWWVSQTPIP